LFAVEGGQPPNWDNDAPPPKGDKGRCDKEGDTLEVPYHSWIVIYKGAQE
jgi:hypothetical protein